MFENLKTIKRYDPAAKSFLEIVLCYPGLHAIWLHQIAHFFYKLGIPLLPRLLNTLSRFLTGLDIHPGAKLADGIFIDHGMGVVIGETAEISKGCLIYQGVTLGGTGKEDGKRHPTLKENVVVGSGAKVLGNIVIGKNVRIGAGSIVLKDVPDNCTVVGLPAYIVKNPSNQTIDESNKLDHSALPNPVAKVFAILSEKVDGLQQEIVELSKELAIQQNKEIPQPTQEELQNNEIIQDFINGGGI
ncbi:MAG: serine O-acetyltransferase [Spirochaetota bacterium]